MKKLQELKHAKVPNIIEANDESITMDFIQGKMLKECLTVERAQKLGKAIAEIHDKNIIHGDITTSNVLVEGDNLVIIDFGLAATSERIEDKAVDLHVFKETLEGKHPSIYEQAFEAFLKGYSLSEHSSIVIERLHEVEKRGRNKQKS